MKTKAQTKVSKSGADTTPEQKKLLYPLRVPEQPAWVKHLTGDPEKLLLNFYLDKFKELDVKPKTGKELPEHRLNDIGMAKLFHDIHKEIIIFVRDVKEYYVYNGIRYEPNSSLASEICKVFFEALAIHAEENEGATLVPEGHGYKLFSKYASEFHAPGKRKAILADAASISPASIDTFDAKPMLINFQNGTYDFNTMEFREHRASDRLTTVCRAEYNAEAICERFNEFIPQIMENDPEKIRHLQKCMGYAISGDTSMECFLNLRLIRTISCFYPLRWVAIWEVLAPPRILSPPRSPLIGQAGTVGCGPAEG